MSITTRKPLPLPELESEDSIEAQPVEEETSQNWLLRHLRLFLEDVDDVHLTNFIHKQDITVFRNFMMGPTTERRCLFVVIQRKTQISSSPTITQPAKLLKQIEPIKKPVNKNMAMGEVLKFKENNYREKCINAYGTNFGTIIKCINKENSGCKLIISTSLVYGLNQQERNAVLSSHNSLRASVSAGTFVAGGKRCPKATNMATLTYSTSLEQSAQNWANQCQVNVHSGTSGVGENLYYMWSTNSLNNYNRPQLLTDAANYWANEAKLYDCTLQFSSALSNKGIGHLTQMIWAKTTQVGCGIASCNGGNTLYVVCQYSPQGNIFGQNIYNA